MARLKNSFFACTIKDNLDHHYTKVLEILQTDVFSNFSFGL